METTSVLSRNLEGKVMQRFLMIFLCVSELQTVLELCSCVSARRQLQCLLYVRMAVKSYMVLRGSVKQLFSLQFVLCCLVLKANQFMRYLYLEYFIMYIVY